MKSREEGRGFVPPKRQMVSRGPPDRRGFGRGVLASQVPGEPRGVRDLRVGLGLDVGAVLLGDGGPWGQVVDLPPEAAGGGGAELGDPPVQIGRAGPSWHTLGVFRDGGSGCEGGEG